LQIRVRADLILDCQDIKRRS